MPNVSERRVCATIGVPRSAVRERSTTPRVPVVDEVLAARLQRLIAQHPTFGYRRLWALLRCREGLRITHAMECAIALQRAFAEHSAATGEPLSVRVGINAGEPIQEDGDLFGATVILASRIAAKATGGQILIPEPARHLLSGKTFSFSARGEFTLKGFEEPIRLYEVRWRE